MRRLSRTCPKALPRLLCSVDVSCASVHAKRDCRPVAVVSLAFPIPSKCRDLAGPEILEDAKSSFVRLAPRAARSGYFCLSDTEALGRLVVTSFPTKLRKVSLGDGSIGVGQKRGCALGIIPMPRSIARRCAIA